MINVITPVRKKMKGETRTRGHIGGRIRYLRGVLNTSHVCSKRFETRIPTKRDKLQRVISIHSARTLVIESWKFDLS